jgi:hypothetical protein
VGGERDRGERVRRGDDIGGRANDDRRSPEEEGRKKSLSEEEGDFPLHH